MGILWACLCMCLPDSWTVGSLSCACIPLCPGAGENGFREQQVIGGEYRYAETAQCRLLLCNLLPSPPLPSPPLQT